jgi:putative transposase
MIHHRRSIRLPGYDYSQPGEYFLTMVSHHRQSIFGTVDGDRVRLTSIGQIVRDCWKEIPSHFSNTEIGPFVVMPNHFHGISQIIDGDGRGKACLAPTGTNEKFGKPIPGSIPTIIGSFKSAVTNRINQIRGTHGQPVWQRNYYEHIINTDDEYLNIAAYIEDNPANWISDKEYT